jgi:hypothetical protein
MRRISIGDLVRGRLERFIRETAEALARAAAEPPAR